MHHYDPVVVADQATGRPLVGVIATAIDAETLVPVQAYRDGNPITLLSGAHGLIGEFQTDETTRRVQITAGPVTLHRWCQELVGASGLVFGYFGYLLVRAFVVKTLSHRILYAVIAIVVAVLYGGSMLTGVLPVRVGISWQGHLFGAIGGGLAAWLLRPRTPVPAKPANTFGF